MKKYCLHCQNHELKIYFQTGHPLLTGHHDSSFVQTRTGWRTIDRFKVACLVAWPLNESGAGVDLVIIGASIRSLCKFL